MANDEVTSQEQSRVTRLSIQRLHNLGNYESVRYEVTVDVALGDDAGKLFVTVENILNDVQAKDEVDSYILSRAKNLLAKPSENLTDADKAMIPQSRDAVRKHESVQERRAAASAALSTLNYTREHRDAKDSWDDDDRDY